MTVPKSAPVRKTYYRPRRSNAPLMAVGVAVLLALAVVVIVATATHVLSKPDVAWAQP